MRDPQNTWRWSEALLAPKYIAVSSRNREKELCGVADSVTTSNTCENWVPPMNCHGETTMAFFWYANLSTSSKLLSRTGFSCSWFSASTISSAPSPISTTARRSFCFKLETICEAQLTTCGTNRVSSIFALNTGLDRPVPAWSIFKGGTFKGNFPYTNSINLNKP